MWINNINAVNSPIVTFSPYDIKVPPYQTIKAIAEAERISTIGKNTA